MMIMMMMTTMLVKIKESQKNEHTHEPVIFKFRKRRKKIDFLRPFKSEY